MPWLPGLHAMGSALLRTILSLSMVAHLLLLLLFDQAPHARAAATFTRASMSRFWTYETTSELYMAGQECLLAPETINPAKNLVVECTIVTVVGDVTLSTPLWTHGKSIRVNALVLNVTKSATFRVNGRHQGMGGVSYGPGHRRDGHGCGAHGWDGAHGSDGTNGGNIVIQAGSIVSVGGAALALHAYGGNGGRGQDGGNGITGCPGESRGGCGCYGDVRGRGGHRGGNAGWGGYGGRPGAGGRILVVVANFALSPDWKLPITTASHRGLTGHFGAPGIAGPGGPGGSSGHPPGTCGHGRRRRRRHHVYCAWNLRYPHGPQGPAGSGRPWRSPRPITGDTGATGLYAAPSLALLPGVEQNFSTWVKLPTSATQGLQTSTPLHPGLAGLRALVRQGLDMTFLIQAQQTANSFFVQGKFDESIYINAEICRLAARNTTDSAVPIAVLPHDMLMAPPAALIGCARMECLTRGLDPECNPLLMVSRLTIEFAKGKVDEQLNAAEEIEEHVAGLHANINDAQKRDASSKAILQKIASQRLELNKKKSAAEASLHANIRERESISSRLLTLFAWEDGNRTACDDAVQREMARQARKKAKAKRRGKILKAVVIAAVAVVAIGGLAVFAAAGAKAAAATAGTFTAKAGAFFKAGSAAVKSHGVVQAVKAGAAKWKALPAVLKTPLKYGAEELGGKLWQQMAAPSVALVSLAGPSQEEAFDHVLDVVDRNIEALDVQDAVSLARARMKEQKRLMIDVTGKLKEKLDSIMFLPECREYFESLRVMLNYTTELGLLDQQHDGLVAAIMLTDEQLNSLERLEEVHNKQRKVEHSLLSAKDVLKNAHAMYDTVMDFLVSAAQTLHRSSMGTFLEESVFSIDDTNVASVRAWLASFVNDWTLRLAQQRGVKSQFASFGGLTSTVPMPDPSRLYRRAFEDVLVIVDPVVIAQLRSSGKASFRIPFWHPVLLQRPGLVAGDIRVYIIGATELTGFLTVSVTLDAYREQTSQWMEQIVTVMDGPTHLDHTYDTDSYKSLTRSSPPAHTQFLALAGNWFIEVKGAPYNFWADTTKADAIVIAFSGEYHPATCAGLACLPLPSPLLQLQAVGVPYVKGAWGECQFLPPSEAQENADTCSQRREVTCPVKFDENFCRALGMPSEEQECPCPTSTSTTSSTSTSSSSSTSTSVTSTSTSTSTRTSATTTSTTSTSSSTTTSKSSTSTSTSTSTSSITSGSTTSSSSSSTSTSMSSTSTTSTSTTTSTSSSTVTSPTQSSSSSSSTSTISSTTSSASSGSTTTTTSVTTTSSTTTTTSSSTSTGTMCPVCPVCGLGTTPFGLSVLSYENDGAAQTPEGTAASSGDLSGMDLISEVIPPSSGPYGLEARPTSGPSAGPMVDGDDSPRQDEDDDEADDVTRHTLSPQRRQLAESSSSSLANFEAFKDADGEGKLPLDEDGFIAVDSSAEMLHLMVPLPEQLQLLSCSVSGSTNMSHANELPLAWRGGSCLAKDRCLQPHPVLITSTGHSSSIFKLQVHSMHWRGVDTFTILCGFAAASEVPSAVPGLRGDCSASKANDTVAAEFEVVAMFKLASPDHLNDDGHHEDGTNKMCILDDSATETDEFEMDVLQVSCDMHFALPDGGLHFVQDAEAIDDLPGAFKEAMEVQQYAEDVLVACALTEDEAEMTSEQVARCTFSLETPSEGDMVEMRQNILQALQDFDDTTLASRLQEEWATVYQLEAMACKVLT